MSMCKWNGAGRARVVADRIFSDFVVFIVRVDCPRVKSTPWYSAVRVTVAEFRKCDANNFCADSFDGRSTTDVTSRRVVWRYNVYAGPVTPVRWPSLAVIHRSVPIAIDVFVRHDVIEHKPNDTAQEPGFDIDEIAWCIRWSHYITKSVHR